MLQNCDELFNYQELSAVPAWNNQQYRFNSGVFVYYPDVGTFSKIVAHSNDKLFDDGDDGLLNSFFSTWGLQSDVNSQILHIGYNMLTSVYLAEIER